MEQLQRKGKLSYGVFEIQDNGLEIDIPQIVLTMNTFEYDLDNIEDTHQRLVELEKKVYRGVNDMKPPVLFDMWDFFSKDQTSQKILQLIRGCGPIW